MSDTQKAIEAVWKIESTRLIAGIGRVTATSALRRNGGSTISLSGGFRRPYPSSA